MRIDYDQIDEEVSEMLSKLLDRFSGALILVRATNGCVMVVAGGASSRGEDSQEYKELIEIAPEVIRQWVQEAVPSSQAERN